MLLRKNDAVLKDSRALIEMLATLGGAWRLVWALWVVPAIVRDAVLRTVSRHRKRLAGAPEPCKRPDPALEWRFLVD